MPPLYPPEYPYRPDAPLLSLGPSFSEDLSRSVVRAIWHENRDQPHETIVRTAAGLTMLEAFHPRDQLECMLAAQGVAAHCAIMDNFGRAADPDLPPQLAIKFRTNAVAMHRMFCLNLRELAHLQSRPLPPRPGPPPTSPTGEPPSPPEAASVAKPRANPAPAETANPTVARPQFPPAPSPEPLVPLEDLPELPEDVETRPDGTPGNLTAYTPKPPPAPPYVPREPLIMAALATRPKPWRMVNVPKDQVPEPVVAPPASMEQEPERLRQRGPVDLMERIFTGDALARFAATRLDPNASIEPLQFDDDTSIVELELISTGGDASAEADQAAMKAAHPDGKPIVTYRHGSRLPAEPPLPHGKDDTPPDC